MASAMYPLGKQAILNKEIDMDSDTIKVRAVSDAQYTYSSAHQYLSSVTAYTGSTDYTLTGKTITNGVFDANDAAPAFASLAISGSNTIDGYVIYRDSGSAATSQLLAYIDLTTSVTPNGSNINITWDNGANKIFALVG